uniref:M20/M25/M40 family metallo-hydrolase n=1 Tax=Thermorudis sp. TaxID=1969470 RepID=A0A7C2WRT6_9BACT
MERFDEYVAANVDRWVTDLKHLCAQPSIAATGVGLREAAALVREMLQAVGAEARLVEVPGGPPVVYGAIGDGPRTLLVYNHYDVQPADPLELWTTPPFEPQVRDGALYARGASDNKGNIVARLAAVQAWQATMGPLPLRLTFVVEGEEEIGSPHLAAFVDQNRPLLAADGCLWEAGGVDSEGRLELFLGLKGILYVELEVQGARRDLHSMWGATVENPAWRLVHALATLRDDAGRVTVDGWMERVREPDDADRRLLDTIPFDEERVKANLGISSFLGGLSGRDLVTSHVFGPTCTICGVVAGYTGEGAKTVLPNRALAKLDFRLVPDLTPEHCLALLRAHLDRRGFADVDVRALGTLMPAKSPPDAAVVRAARAAAEAVYPGVVVYPMMPGSGPMHTLCQGLGIPAVSTGIGHAGSGAHAPNEHIRLANLEAGIRWLGRFFQAFAVIE